MISLTTHKTISNGELTVFNKNEHFVLCRWIDTEADILLVAPHFVRVKGKENL